MHDEQVSERSSMLSTYCLDAARGAEIAHGAIIPRVRALIPWVRDYPVAPEPQYPTEPTRSPAPGVRAPSTSMSTQSSHLVTLLNAIAMLQPALGTHTTSFEPQEQSPLVV
jgi:hypothetical protein